MRESVDSVEQPHRNAHRRLPVSFDFYAQLPD
jgi:hypothetical protein